MPILPTSLDPISNCLLIAASHHANFSPLTLDSHQPQPKLKAAAILSDLTSASSPAARLLPACCPLLRSTPQSPVTTTREHHLPVWYCKLVIQYWNTSIFQSSDTATIDNSS
jgi:hypothetical protein